MPTIVGQRRERKANLASNDGKIDYSTTLIYIVYDDTGGANEAQILTTPGLPVVNEPITLPDVPYQCACKSKECEQWEANKRYWNVSCEIVSFEFPVWVPGSGSGSGENDSDDPETWEPQIKFSFEQIDDIAYNDINGNPIVNTAKRRYATPLTVKKLIPVWRFTQYESSDVSLDTITERHSTVNENTFAIRRGRPTGYLAGMWLLLIDDAQIVFRNGRRLWKIDYCLKYKENTVKNCCIVFEDGTLSDPLTIDTGWRPALMQIDYLDINGNPLKDGNKMEIEDFLSKDGLQLFTRPGPTGDPLFVMHKIYKEISFDFLRI
jgi:hypothetical protein